MSILYVGLNTSFGDFGFLRFGAGFVLDLVSSLINSCSRFSPEGDSIDYANYYSDCCRAFCLSKRLAFSPPFSLHIFIFVTLII